jgi:hypothetical protein
MKYFIALLLGLSLSGCRDFKFVLGDDSSDQSQQEETNTDSKNTTTTSAGSSMLDWGNK